MIFVRMLAAAGFWLAFVAMVALYAAALTVAVVAGFLARMAGFCVETKAGKPHP